MERIAQIAGVVYRGLFLRTDAYEEMRDSHNPFVEGLFIVILIGVFVAVASVVGTTLFWASSPDPTTIQQALYDGLTNMTWYEELRAALGNQFSAQFQTWWNHGFRIARALFPTPLSSLTRIITTPLALIITWIIYGLLAHLFARLLGGEATLSQTLGATGLAMAPNLLRVAGFLPAVTVGGVVGTWVLICRYVALKQTHGLSWGRAFWATVLPRLVLWLLSALLAVLGMAIFGAMLPSLGAILGRFVQ